MTKKIKVRDLEKLNRIYNHITKLDKDIIQIEKCADVLANKDNELSITICVTDLEKRNKERMQVTLDKDGDIIGLHHPPGAFNIQDFFAGRWPSSPANPKERDIGQQTLSEKYSDTTALEILAIMLREKLKERDGCLKELRKLGIEI